MAKLARLPANDRAPMHDGAEGDPIVRLQTRYYAFLSYSHKDHELADWLHTELESFRVPSSMAGRLTANGVIPKRLTPIFRDRHELAAAGDLGAEIRSALAASQYLIVLCSPDAAVSHWTNAEIDAFKRTRPDGCVLAAIAGGEPFASDVPGREKDECLPPALRHRYDRRGRPTAKRAEPLAADLRETGDGRRLGFLKLVAGMLGVGLDDLVQRETTRRQRRLAWLAAASLAGMTMTSSLAVFALHSRDAARDQRRQAEGLVAFMLGDLKDKLEPIGRLDVLDGVGAKVLEYYSKQDTSQLSDAGLVQRSRALSLSAQVTYLRGDFASAQKLYREAMEGTAEAIRRKPDDPQRLFDHAQNVFWVGDLARQQGQIDRAQSAYLEYKRLADRMTALEPDNLKWRMEVQYARSNLGIIAMRRRNFAEAAQLFGSTLGPVQSFASIDPGNGEYQQTLANGLGWYADAERALGHLDAASAARERQINFLNQVIGQGQADVVLRERLVSAQQGLGMLLEWRGQGEKGVEHYRFAVATADQLRMIEPDNSRWSDLAGNARLELARNLLAVGRQDEAARDTVLGCQTAAALRARDASVSRWATLQTLCLTMRSRLAIEAGDRTQALNLAVLALASARAERSDDPVSDRYNVAAAYQRLGDIRRSSGDLAGANAAWLAGLTQLPRTAVEIPLEMYIRAQLLQRVNRSDEARPLFDRLKAEGFKVVD